MSRRILVSCLLLFLIFGFVSVQESWSATDVRWGLSAGIRTPGHSPELDFTCGPEVQPRARLGLSERFLLDVVGFFGSARTLPYKHVNQTAFGLTVMPAYSFTSLDYAETSGRSYVGFGPIVRMSKKHGYVLWGEYFHDYGGLENTEYQDYRFDFEDSWNTTFGFSIVLGGETPIWGGRLMVLDIRYMYFFDTDEDYSIEWNGDPIWFNELRTAGWTKDYTADLKPNRLMSVTVGVLF